MISFEDFKKIELKTAKIITADRVEGSEKFLKLQVDIGLEQRQIVAGIGKVYTPAELIGRYIVIVANLEPRNLMGIESEGMLLAADDGGRPVLLQPEREVPSGSQVR